MLKALHQGTTLIELLTALAILALAVSTSIPSLTVLLEKNQLTTTFDDLRSALQEARTLAITKGKSVEVCAYSQSKQCGTDWNLGWMIRTAGTQEIFRISIWHQSKGYMHWSGYNKTIRFRPNGSSPTSNGRLVVCGSGELIGQLIINRQGRIRQSSSTENLKERSRCP